MTRNNPSTSIDAYKSLQLSEVRETYQKILSALDVIGKGTMEDIAAYMKCSRDRVWKRLSEMERLEMIYKPGTKKVLKSGRYGYEWMRTNPSKTDHQQKEITYRKGEKSSSDYSAGLLRAIQQNLFP